MIAFIRLTVSVTLTEGVEAELGAVQLDAEAAPAVPALDESVIPLVLAVVEDVVPLPVEDEESTVPVLVAVVSRLDVLPPVVGGAVPVEVEPLDEVERLVVVVLCDVVAPLEVVVVSIVPELTVDVTRSPELVDVVLFELLAVLFAGPVALALTLNLPELPQSSIAGLIAMAELATHSDAIAQV